MEYSPIIAPVVALVAWSLAMMFWMMATRFGAMRRKGISLKGKVGSRGSSLDGVIDDNAQWKAHNYNHLMEQPTIFYAIALALALIDQGDGFNLILAWAYVGLRIVHSLVQSTSNKLSVRFPLFALASLALLGLTVHAGAALLLRG